MKLTDKIEKRIKNSEQFVFLREDFGDLAGYDQVGRSLKQLVSQEKLVRVGYGVYVKTRVSLMTGKAIPVTNGGVDSIFIETINRLGVEWEFTGLTEKYLNGEVTQVPAGKEIKIINKKRFQRKLCVETMEFEPQF